MTVVEATAIAAAALVAAVVGVIVVRSVDRRPPPSAVALGYLDAISRGDAATANELFDPAVDDGGASVDGLDRWSFLAPAALSGASERITGVRVIRTATSRRSQRSFVYYSYELAGAAFEGRPLALRWNGASWQLESGSVHRIDVEATFSDAPIPATMTIRFGGAEVAIAIPPVRRCSFLAYPGRYPIVVGVDGWNRIPPTDAGDEVTLAATGADVLVVPHFTPALTPPR